MGTKTITVTWDGSVNGPTAPDVTVNQSDGQTTIQWVAGTDVQNISILNLDSSEFTGLSGNGTDTVTATDLNSNSKNAEYSYTIQAQHKSGRTGMHDPKIKNLGRPTLTTRRKPELQA